MNDEKKTKGQLIQELAEMRQRFAELEAVSMGDSETLLEKDSKKTNLKPDMLQAQQIASLGSWDWDMLSGEVLWSDNMYRLLGYRPGDVASDYDIARSHVNPDDLEKYDKKIEKALQLFALKGSWTNIAKY